MIIIKPCEPAVTKKLERFSKKDDFKQTVPVDNCGELFHRSPIQQNIHLYQISSPVACVLIVKAMDDKTMESNWYSIFLNPTLLKTKFTQFSVVDNRRIFICWWTFPLNARLIERCTAERKLKDWFKNVFLVTTKIQVPNWFYNDEDIILHNFNKVFIILSVHWYLLAVKRYLPTSHHKWWSNIAHYELKTLSTYYMTVS